MKKTLLFSVCAALTASLVSCGGPGGKAKTAETADAKTAKKAVPEYTVVDNAQVDLASFPQDKDGYYVIFDGSTAGAATARTGLLRAGRGRRAPSSSTARAAARPRRARAAT